jgi:hypothetical protein
MLHVSEQQLSVEDAQLIEAYQLGTLLGVYRRKPSYIRFNRIAGSFFVFVGGITLLLVLIVLFKHPPSPDILPLTVLLYLLQSLGPILIGLFIFYRIVPRERQARAVVCERGLLYVGSDLRKRSIEVVEWAHIRRIYKGAFGQGYSLIRWSGESLPLSFYQDVEGLVGLVKALSTVEQE